MFIEKEIISLFLQMLEFPDSKLVLNILTGLESVLDFLRAQKKPILEDKSLKNRLEELQYHPDVAVWEKTQKIIENFFLSE